MGIALNETKLRSGLAQRIMGFPKETFRYWRAHIDPKPTRTHYTFSDMFVYRVFDHFINKKGVSVESLEHCDWRLVFELANNSSYENLRNCRVLLNRENNSVSLIHRNQIFDPDDEYLIWVHLKYVTKEHEDMLLERENKKELSEEEFMVRLGINNKVLSSCKRRV